MHLQSSTTFKTGPKTWRMKAEHFSLFRSLFNISRSRISLIIAVGQPGSTWSEWPVGGSCHQHHDDLPPSPYDFHRLKLPLYKIYYKTAFETATSCHSHVTKCLLYNYWPLCFAALGEVSQGALQEYQGWRINFSNEKYSDFATSEISLARNCPWEWLVWHRIFLFCSMTLGYNLVMRSFGNLEL